MLNRRRFLASSIVTFTGTGLIAWIGSPIAAKAKSADKDTVKIIQFSDAGQNLGPALVKKVHKTDDEWKQQLSPLQYQVTRREGTERAFSSQYDIHDIATGFTVGCSWVSVLVCCFSSLELTRG